MKTLNRVAKLSILGLLVIQQSAAFAADSAAVAKNNPFKPQPSAAEKAPPTPAPQPATPVQHGNGIGNGMSFNNNMHTFNPADMAAPPSLPGAPGAPSAEARPKYIGTVNGVGIYRAEAGYKFDETALAPVQNAPAK